jgi:hypothetical protein
MYHRAGNITVEGHTRKDEKFAWTHPYAERETCVACLYNRIPDEIRRAPK